MLSETKSRLSTAKAGFAGKRLLLLFVAFLLFHLTALAQEGWFWQHPLPQGNDLRDVVVLDQNTIFAVGDRGTLLRSDNAGADWEITYRLADITENIVDIQFISEQKGFLLANKHILEGDYNIVYSSSKILYTEDSGMNWQVIADFDSLRLNDLFFIDENIGWAVGYKGGTVGTLTGKIFRTTNGGYNWDTLFVQYVTDQPRQDDKAISFSTIQFIDSENGWAAGESSLWGQGWGNGELLKTSDGGLNWSVLNNSINVITSFQFLNSEIGWLINYRLHCYCWDCWLMYDVKKTTDGGLNWEDVFTGSSNHSSTFSLPSLYFIDPNTGWVKQSGAYNRAIHKTTNSGLSWLMDTLHTPWNGAMHFNDELNGCVVGKNGEILSTQDGGQLWIERSTMITYYYARECHFSAVDFYDENIGWATAWDYHPYPAEGGWNNGRIYGTSDGGCTWVEQAYIDIESNANINDVQAVTDQIAYAVGHTVYKTTNGGTNWNSIINDPGCGYFTLFFLNADIGFVGGGGYNLLDWENGIFKTTDGGIIWNNVLPVSDDNSIKSIFFINNSVGWALCWDYYQNYFYKTIDEGETWQEISVNNFRLKSICFINEDIGFAVGRDTSGDGVIIRSNDGGYNWDVIYNLNGYEFRSICFIDSSRGFVVGLDNSYLLDNHNYNPSGIVLSISSDDEGENWSVSHESWTKGLNDVYFLNKNTGWAVGYGGTIIKTTTGGVVFVEEEQINEIPTKYYLSQNYPNPFNPNTKIRYSIPRTSNVVIKVFDILGNEIKTLVNERKVAGTYELTWYAEQLPSGVYFYRLQAEDYVETRKMIMMK